MKGILQQLMLSILACVLGHLGFAQVSITPVYQNTALFSSDHLIQVNLINVTPNPITGHVEVQIEGPDQQLVGRIKSFDVQLQPGIVLNGNTVNWEVGFTFGSSVFANVFRNTGKLPFGEFTICYRFIGAEDGSIQGINCQEKRIKIAGLPRLVTPMHEAELNNLYPQLTWLPPLPLTGSGLSYDLVLVKIKNEQSLAEAISLNRPLLNLNNLSQTSLNYPPTAQQLQTSSEYAWQVTAYWNKIEVGKTEIWRFSIKSGKVNTTSRAPEDYDHFFGLTQNAMASGGYHVREDGVLPILYNNRGLDNELNYTIREVGGDGDYLTNLPAIALIPGINHIELNLSAVNVGGLSLNKRYLLHVIDLKGTDYYLEFLNLRIDGDGGN